MTLDSDQGQIDAKANNTPDHSDALTVEAVRVIAGAVANATAPADGLTPVQQAVLNALCEFLLGFAIDLGSVARVGPDEFADVMRGQDPSLCVRIVQSMLVGALLLVPLPAEVMDRVQVYADALGVDDEVIRVARRAADGCLEVAMIDFERSGYFDHLRDQPAIQELSALKGDSDVWQRVWDEEDLYDRWSNLETCPPGSLGQGVWRFYMARGFVFPGRPESAPPVLAQHDWIHVLADYGSTIESEIEVFGLIARANHDFRGFSLLAIVLSLFETGHLAEAAGGFFQKDGGHISRDAKRMGVRLADAMSRGKRLALHLDAVGRQEESDLLAVDWFKHAERSIDDVCADFGLQPKSARARTAGSVSPWQAGGMSVYQLRLGRERAAASGRDYAAFDASPRV